MVWKSIWELNTINPSIVSETTKLISAEQTADGKRYENSLTLAAHISKTKDWFDAVGRVALAAADVTWKVDDFCEQLFGMKKSFCYKLIKADGLDKKIKTAYLNFVTREREQGKRCSKSISGLLSFAKGESPEQVPTICSFVLKGEGAANLTIDENGKVTTKSSAEEIEAAIKVMQAMLTEFAAKETEGLGGLLDALAALPTLDEAEYHQGQERLSDSELVAQFEVAVAKETKVTKKATKKAKVAA